MRNISLLRPMKRTTNPTKKMPTPMKRTANLTKKIPNPMKRTANPTKKLPNPMVMIQTHFPTTIMINKLNPNHKILL